MRDRRIYTHRHIQLYASVSSSLTITHCQEHPRVHPQELCCNWSVSVLVAKSGKFFRIKTPTNLRAEVGSYYRIFYNNDKDKPVITAPYVDFSGLGKLTTGSSVQDVVMIMMMLMTMMIIMMKTTTTTTE